LAEEEVEMYRIDHKKGGFVREEQNGFAIEHYFRITVTPLLLWLVLVYISHYALLISLGKPIRLSAAGLSDSLANAFTYPLIVGATFVLFQAAIAVWLGFRTVRLTHGSYVRAMLSAVLFAAMQYGVQYLLLAPIYPGTRADLDLMARLFGPLTFPFLGLRDIDLGHVIELAVLGMAGVFAAHAAADE